MPRSLSLMLTLAAALLLLIIGLLMLHPIYFNVCEAAQQGAKQKCELHDALHVALLNAWNTIFHAEFLTALATIAIAAFTLTLKWSTDRLWKAGEHQLTHFEDTAQKQLRAYLNVKNVVMSLMNTEYNPNIQVIIKNYGQTPAYRVTNTYDCFARDRPREREFTLEGVEARELADLAPTQRVFSTTSLDINRWTGMKPCLISKKQRFYVFGRINYFDAFGTPQWTEFRFRLMIGADGIQDEMSLVMDGHSGNRSS